MPAIAYLANLFPAASEGYVVDEICELRQRGITVVPCSVRRPAPQVDPALKPWINNTIYLYPLRLNILLAAAWLCISKAGVLKSFLARVLLQGNETPAQRARALAHTLLGIYNAVLLQKFDLRHIHVHHGYFGSWVAMVAAKLLGVPFSMTLHGSDLLLHPAYLDIKLEHCQFCRTISEFNRQHILNRHPKIDPGKIAVQRLGVDCTENCRPASQEKRDPSSFVIFSAGRLHPVKDHKFLVRACRELKSRGVKFSCRIVGEGPKRQSLEGLICALGLQNEVQLLGEVLHAQMRAYYEMADLVVLTSRSEGIPLVLMEAMAHEKVVLAPAITGIPELIRDAETGFLYRPGSLEDFVAKVEMIRDTHATLGQLQQAARAHVVEHFNRQSNLAAFCDHIAAQLGLAPTPDLRETPSQREISYENPVLQ